MELPEIKPGTYVVAVSGGVDSMALLHTLQWVPDLHLVVAHFDHGIRADSAEDQQLVQTVAAAYRLPFISERAELGPGASEADAREARYAFLRRVMQTHGAEAIITAHHQGDAIETAILNVIRGTKRKGLSSLRSSEGIIRPLLSFTKDDLILYATQEGLVWREDSTNTDTKYARNYVRLNILPRISQADQQKLMDILDKSGDINNELDDLLDTLLREHSSERQLDRDWFVGLPHEVAREVMASWLRQNGLRDFDEHMIERLVVVAKVARPSKQIDVMGGATMRINGKSLALTVAER